MDLFGPNRCQCEACSDSPGPTYTAKYRHECEVRMLIGMTDHADRKAYVDGVQKHRGANAAERLRQDAWKLMKVIA